MIIQCKIELYVLLDNFKLFALLGEYDHCTSPPPPQLFATSWPTISRLITNRSTHTWSCDYLIGHIPVKNKSNCSFRT